MARAVFELKAVRYFVFVKHRAMADDPWLKCQYLKMQTKLFECTWLFLEFTDLGKSNIGDIGNISNLTGSSYLYD